MVTFRSRRHYFEFSLGHFNLSPDYKLLLSVPVNLAIIYVEREAKIGQITPPAIDRQVMKKRE